MLYVIFKCVVLNVVAVEGFATGASSGLDSTLQFLLLLQPLVA
jgi:hypothetical protein